MEQLTNAELKERIQGLLVIFDAVRIVDPSAMRQIIFRADGAPVASKDYCFAFWKKNSRCANCISARTFQTKRRAYKFEFVDDDIYMIVTEYMEVDEKPCVLESILHLDDGVLIDAYGKNQFVSQITRYNDRMYLDSLTNVRNRRFFDEQASGLTVQATAMIDIDHFKQINDTWLHKAGDVALQTVADVIISSVRKSDLVIRYGGDEFLIAFQEIPREVFSRKLEEICANAKKATIPGYPQISLTLSIGGIYEKGMLMDEIEKADEELYEAKKTRGHVVIKTVP
ncbi:MAG: GGDEF domain-containing protein [Bilifractor sp.]